MARTTICAECATVFEAQRRDARFCSQACKKRAQRRGKRVPVYPAEPPRIPKQATEEDVLAAIVSARTSANTFSQLGKVAPYELRAGCVRISQKIEQSIKDEGWIQ